ncbi:hypothetical protein [Spongiactinospora sp. 9N601]|uniref:hypothetical protein n=1 Tax=Spongiactinospora sp. 9N601 TaxID=3375149 RepID=UPI003797A281
MEKVKTLATRIGRRGAACAVLAAAIVMSVPAAADAAEPNQLCRTNSSAILYTSPTSGIWVPQGSLVRILDYRGPLHYLARYDGTVGQLERSKIIQASCYYQ